MKKFLINILHNIGCYFVTILTFLIGGWFVYCSLGNSLFVFIQIVLLGCFPFALFLTFSILKNNLHNQKSKEFISNSARIVTLFLPFYFFFAIFYCAFLEANNPITNPKSYKYKVHDDYLLEAFPKKIPENAENVFFVYQPGLLQAGSFITLYFIDTEFDMQGFHNQYKDKSIWIGYRYQKNDANLDLSNSLEDVPTKNKEEFLIYLMDYKCDDSSYCNHGHYLFAAINEKTKEVIYKFAQW